jgi:general stress protein YciG
MLMSTTQEQPKMSKAEAGRLGGQVTKERHGREHYEKIGKAGGQKTVKRHGQRYYGQR